MFGTKRERLARARPVLSDFQEGRCFSLAQRSCNAAKEDRRTAYEHLHRCGRKVELD
jgi:hypothetical protein